MASTYISRVNGTPTSAYKWTWSGWVKRAKLGTRQMFFRVINPSSTADYAYIEFDGANDNLQYIEYDGTNAINGITNAKYRDTSGWYHIVVATDTTQVTGSDRIKLYVNGEQITSFATHTYGILNQTTRANSSGKTLAIGANGTGSNLYFDGSMSHVNFVDGLQLSASDFGEYDANGVWKINTSPSVTYGTNGFFILKDGNSVTDQSGNGNNFTVAGGTLTNTEDSPSNVFATLNSLTKTGNDIKTVGNGNTSVTASSSSAWGSLYSTLGASTGKFYCEVKITDTYGPDANNFALGIQDVTTFNQSSNEEISTNSTGFAYKGNGNKMTNNSQTSYGNTYTTGDIVGVAMDLDNQKLYFSKNGTWQNSGVPTSGSTGTGSAFDLVSGTTYVFGMASYYTQDDYQFNFGNGYFGTTAVSSAGTNASGNGIFEFDVPTGFTALSTKGLNL